MSGMKNFFTFMLHMKCCRYIIKVCREQKPSRHFGKPKFIKQWQPFGHMIHCQYYIHEKSVLDLVWSRIPLSMMTVCINFPHPSNKWMDQYNIFPTTPFYNKWAPNNLLVHWARWTNSYTVQYNLQSPTVLKFSLPPWFHLFLLWGVS